MPRRTILRAELTERQVTMMAFNACVGFGLFLQSGVVVYLGGPGLAIIAFLLACSIMWAIVGCLGEMSALFPIHGPLFEFPRRFLDEAVGYATGWTIWFSWCVCMAAQLTTIAQLWKFRFAEDYLQEVSYPDQTLGWSTERYSAALWVFIFFFVIGAINCLPVKQYGEVEYFIGVVKMIFISGLILFNLCLSGIQKAGRSHFWTWNEPWGFSTDSFPLRVDENYAVTDRISGDTGRFIALWTAITTIMFSLAGFETVALSAPENKDLEKHETMKIATKKTFIRITLLYTLATFTGGLNVPYDDRYLADANWGSISGGQNSLFIIAAVRNKLRGWPSFLNGFFIFSSGTSAINSLYLSSRLLHALAGIPEAWPLVAQATRRRLERTTARGVPLATITVSWMFGLLAFLGLRPNSSKVLGWLSNNATTSCLLTYAVICASYIRFYHCIKRAADDYTIPNSSAFNRDDDQYPYRTSGQLFRAVYGLTFSLLILLFNGWRSFISPFGTAEFIASYISAATFIFIVGLYHIRSDGWNPWKWRSSANMLIQRPPPKVVAPGLRRGVLTLPNQKQLWTEENMKVFFAWLWTWVK